MCDCLHWHQVDFMIYVLKIKIHVTCMNVFRSDHLVLDTLSMSSSLEKTVSPAFSIP